MKEAITSKVLLWEPKHGKRKQGRPASIYIDQLRNDTGLSTAELKMTIEDREEWRKIVDEARVRSN